MPRVNIFGQQGATSPTNFFSNSGGVVSDLFAAEGAKTEATNYRAAAKLAGQNAEFTEYSTGVQELQAKRQEYQVIGQQTADIAGAGFAAGGSGGDLLRDSTAQAALQQETIQKQGDITEESFKEQQASYETMAKAADQGALGKEIGAGLHAVGAIASVFI